MTLKLIAGPTILLTTALVVGCSAPPETANGNLPAAGAATADAAGKALLAVVYKSPTCGCCTKWVEHLQANGFQVEVRDTADVEPAKARWGVPGQLGSCHTAKIGNYVFEGHVPADVIQRVLREKPDIAGVAVPGMPMGSPGMEGPYPADRYDVVSFTRDGGTAVYESR